VTYTIVMGDKPLYHFSTSKDLSHEE